jgi:RNA polymerase sigma-70 factor (ECF subfamily)
MVTDDLENERQSPQCADIADMSLRRIVRRAQAGDRAAFHRIYELYAPLVHSAAMRVVRDAHEAEDVSQQVFAKLMTSIGQYQERSQPFGHWLSRVARNAAVDHVRRRRPIPVEDAGVLSEARPTATPEVLDSLKTALRTLPEEQRQVLLMRHLVGLSPAEIAVETGRTTASVNGLHFRARRHLRQELSGHGLAPATLARAA